MNQGISLAADRILPVAIDFIFLKQNARRKWKGWLGGSGR